MTLDDLSPLAADIEAFAVALESGSPEAEVAGCPGPEASQLLGRRLFLEPDRSEAPSLQTSHAFIERSYPIHICIDIAGYFDGRTEAALPGRPVKKREDNRNLGLLGDSVKARLPVVGMRARSLRWHHQREAIHVVELTG